MFDIQNYPQFVAAIIVFQLAPGAGTLAILQITARNGVTAGFGAVMGTLAGDAIFMVAAVTGLCTIMSTYPILFYALQWLGAGYLIYMGMQLIFSRHTSKNAQAAEQKSNWLYFRQTCIISLTNPKVLLFFVAFFPLFLRPDSTKLTLAAMMCHVTLLSFIYQVGLVMVGNAVSRRLGHIPLLRRIASRLAGLALVGFGISLAIKNS